MHFDGIQPLRLCHWAMTVSKLWLQQQQFRICYRYVTGCKIHWFYFLDVFTMKVKATPSQRKEFAHRMCTSWPLSSCCWPWTCLCCVFSPVGLGSFRKSLSFCDFVFLFCKSFFNFMIFFFPILTICIFDFTFFLISSVTFSFPYFFLCLFLFLLVILNLPSSPSPGSFKFPKFWLGEFSQPTKRRTWSPTIWWSPACIQTEYPWILWRPRFFLPWKSWSFEWPDWIFPAKKTRKNTTFNCR